MSRSSSPDRDLHLPGHAEALRSNPLWTCTSFGPSAPRWHRGVRSGHRAGITPRYSNVSAQYLAALCLWLCLEVPCTTPSDTAVWRALYRGNLPNTVCLGFGVPRKPKEGALWRYVVERGHGGEVPSLEVVSMVSLRRHKIQRDSQSSVRGVQKQRVHRADVKCRRRGIGTICWRGLGRVGAREVLHATTVSPRQSGPPRCHSLLLQSHL